MMLDYLIFLFVSTGAVEQGGLGGHGPPQKICHIKKLHYLSNWQGNQYEN